jgi:hypothetical protein
MATDNPGQHHGTTVFSSGNFEFLRRVSGRQKVFACFQVRSVANQSAPVYPAATFLD